MVDGEGKPVGESDVPDEIREQLGDLARAGLGRGAADGPVSVVVATYELPEGEPPVEVSTSLVARSWSGGAQLCGDLPGLVCIKLTTFNETCRLEIRKMGYQTVAANVPVMGTRNKVIWLGHYRLERHPPGRVTDVGGPILDEHGRGLNVLGRATIRVNGTDDRRECEVQLGSYLCRNVTPGKYLVEFWFADHSVATRSAEVCDDLAPVRQSVTAFPRYTVLFHRKIGVDEQISSVRLGVPYLDGNLDLPDGTRVRANQEGADVSFSTSSHKLLVCRTPVISDASCSAAALPWYSWTGRISPGMYLLLLNDDLSLFASVKVLHINLAMALEEGPRPPV